MEKEIIESNKLIAEFMGYNVEFVNDERYFTLDDMLESLSDEELQYHSSWDWLRPVIEKIDSLTMPDNIHLSIQGLNIFSSLEDVYLAVVEFIKWYNNKEK